MAEFITEEDLSARVRLVLSGVEIQCAVAFLGDGAAELLRDKEQAEIICDLSMGGTFPPELERLGAPTNEKLRFINGLHAKVYISSVGAIVSSANATANGIGNDRRPARLIEAGTFYSPDDPNWRGIKKWFREHYKKAGRVDEAALAYAYQRWEPPKGAAFSPVAVRPGSLLDLVRSNPEAFDGVGFTFSSNLVPEEDAEEARRAVADQHVQQRPEIEQWPRGNIYYGWPEADVRQWPSTFIDFYMPNSRLYINGMETAFLIPEKGVVLCKRRLAALKRNLPISWPTREQIQAVDADVVTRLLSKHGGGKLFPTANHLWKELATLEAGRP